MIVIVDRLDGYHARVVRGHLEKRGARVLIADMRELGAGAELSFDPEAPERAEWLRIDGTRLALGEARAVWIRPGISPELPPELRESGDRRFSTREWRVLARGIFSSLGIPVINPFHAIFEASKPLQLAMALQAGLAVPDTLITNSAVRTREFVERSGPVVHKTLTGMDDRTLATKCWSDAEARALPELVLAPTIFQRRVDGTRELRVTAVGHRLFAAEFSTELPDGRLDHAVPHRPHELPAEVARGILSLLERLGLRFAAVDMRIDARGEYQFLEVNPSGVFLGTEVRTGLPISAAVAELLLAAAEGRST